MMLPLLLLIIIIFILGSVYSTNVSGARQKLKQLIHVEHNIVKNLNWPEANQLGYLQAWLII